MVAVVQGIGDFMENETIEELQARAKQYIETKQYDKVFILNDILKDLEMNPNVFMEGELNRL